MVHADGDDDEQEDDDSEPGNREPFTEPAEPECPEKGGKGKPARESPVPLAARDGAAGAPRKGVDRLSH